MYNGNSFIQMNDHVTKLLPSSNWNYEEVITDLSKRLYVGTNHGFLRFNYETLDFESILTGNIGTVILNSDGVIWLIRDDNIESLNPDNVKNVTRYPLPENVKKPTFSIMASNGIIYVSFNKKIYCRTFKDYYFFHG